MRFAILADIHGNAPALEAVLADAALRKIDAYILAGDYIFDLPFSNAVVSRIRALSPAYAIQGNKEAYLAELSRADPAGWTSEQLGVIHQTYRELDPDHRAWLMGLPQTLRIPLPHHGSVYVAHHFPAAGPPPQSELFSSSAFREEMERSAFDHAEYLERMRAMLSDPAFAQKLLLPPGTTVAVYGHCHLQVYGPCGNVLLINPGACGLPLDCNPMAPYTILDDQESGLTVEERRVPYDVEETIRRARETTICRQGQIWSELVFSAIRDAKDGFSRMFAIARRLATERGETDPLFRNETWRNAARVYADTEALVETPRLRIRRFRPEDWPDLHEYLSQASVVRYEPYGVHSEAESRREAQQRAQSKVYYAVCLKDTGKLIGNLSLSRQAFGTWELGYVLNPKFQGRGYATEAARALVNDAFVHRAAHRVTAMCNPQNTASWRLLERLGMRREGCLLKNVAFKTAADGAPIWTDTWAYAVLWKEWLGAANPAEGSPELPIPRVGEICLLTRDVVRLSNFYKALLRVENGSSDAVHQFIYAKETSLTIHNNGETLPEGPQRAQLAFTVPDVDREYARVAALGVPILEPPATRPWGARNMHFQDPDGNDVFFRSLPQ